MIYIFDLDWTLLNSQWFHQQIEVGFLVWLGAEITTKEVESRFAWRSPREWMWELLEEQWITFTQKHIEGFVDRKNELMRENLYRGSLVLLPHVLRVIEQLNTPENLLGISTWSSRWCLEAFLDFYDLKSMFLATTSANEVLRRKPYPDVWLETFSALWWVDPLKEKRCVIGDSVNDMRGGKEAWARTVYIWEASLNKDSMEYVDIVWEDIRVLLDI